MITRVKLRPVANWCGRDDYREGSEETDGMIIEIDTATMRKCEGLCKPPAPGEAGPFKWNITDASAREVARVLGLPPEHLLGGHVCSRIVEAD